MLAGIGNSNSNLYNGRRVNFKISFSFDLLVLPSNFVGNAKWQTNMNNGFLINS